MSLAKNEVVVFVHQDVYLHSLTALKQAAAQMRADGFGLLGAVGVRSDRLLIGRIRDRILLAGEVVTGRAEADSVDEVLFMAPRRSCSLSHSPSPRIWPGTPTRSSTACECGAADCGPGLEIFR